MCRRMRKDLSRTAGYSSATTSTLYTCYEIDVRSLTEGTDGNWKGLALYDELIAACPQGGANDNERKRKGRLSIKPAGDNQKKHKVLELFLSVHR